MTPTQQVVEAIFAVGAPMSRSLAERMAQAAIDALHDTPECRRCAREGHLDFVYKFCPYCGSERERTS